MKLEGSGFGGRHWNWNFMKDYYRNYRIIKLSLYFFFCLWTKEAAFALPAQRCSCPFTLGLAEAQRSVKSLWNPTSSLPPPSPFWNMFHFCIFLVILKPNSSLAPLGRQIQWETQLSFKTGGLDIFISDIQMSLIQLKMPIIWPSYFFLILSRAYKMSRKIYKTRRQTLMMCSSVCGPC